MQCRVAIMQPRDVDTTAVGLVVTVMQCRVAIIQPRDVDTTADSAAKQSA